MPEIGSCTDITCDDEIKELYECHCCSRLVCLNHLNLHAGITKQNKRRLDSVYNELNTVVTTFELIVEEKLLTIEREKNLIEQAKKVLDLPTSSMVELKNIFEQINQTIASNCSEVMVKVEPSSSRTKHCSCGCKCNKENIGSNDVAEESRISKDDEYSTDINHDFVSFDDTAESIQDEHVNEVEEERKQISYRKIVDTCPLTFDGAYGLTQANHSIEFCEHGTTRRIELYFHFMYKHRIKKIDAQRLIRAIADNQDPRKSKLFDRNENVIDHFYKVPCPFFDGQINSLKSSRRNETISPCQHRLIAFHKLKYHLRISHKMSNSSAQKLVNDLKNDRTKNIALAPLNSSA